MKDDNSTKNVDKPQVAVSSTDWLDGLTWIRIAFTTGAQLSVGHETWNLKATLIWPGADKEPFEAEGRTLREILLDINDQLSEDAAQEMIDKGAV